MNSQPLQKAMGDAMGCNERKARTFTHIVASAIREGLKRGWKVQIRGLGFFQVVKRRPRIVHTLRGRAKVVDGKRILFRASESVKREILGK